MATAATARPAPEPTVPGPAEFRPITLSDTPSPVPEQISDFVVDTRSFAPRPVPAQPNPPKAVTKKVGWSFRGTGHRAAGSATWYCKTGSSVCASGYHGGMYAAAGPELRVGAWRGRIVRVCGGGTCIVVKLIDWCACGGSHLIDLYSDAFRRLAPLDAGALKVTVSW